MTLKKPKFEKTYCSQCGGEFGPADSGYSHCHQHRKMTYDSRSYDLAEHFLQDSPHRDDPWYAEQLAIAIQTAVEDWFYDLELGDENKSS